MREGPNSALMHQWSRQKWRSVLHLKEVCLPASTGNILTRASCPSVVAFNFPAPPAPLLAAHNRILFTSAAYLKTEPEVHCPALSCTALHFSPLVQTDAFKLNKLTVSSGDPFRLKMHSLLSSIVVIYSKKIISGRVVFDAVFNTKHRSFTVDANISGWKR